MRRVPIQKRLRPRNLICNSLPRRLASHPKFKILRSVVASIAVEVMHVLIRVERAPEYLRHHDPVLEIGLVDAGPHANVTSLVDPSVALVPRVWGIGIAVLSPPLVMQVA
jgi:hypothetical protein